MAHERRRFKRLHAPVLCRPAGAALVKGERTVQDISMGGVRVYTDDPHQVGERLELELFLPDATQLILEVEVVWVDALAGDALAKFEVGMRFLELPKSEQGRLESVLRED